MKHLLLTAIRLYQRYLSFDTGILKWVSPSIHFVNSGWASPTCRFSPTCSEYMYQAIERYGIIDGLSLGVKRIVRCHPWSKGGDDPVPI